MEFADFIRYPANISSSLTQYWWLIGLIFVYFSAYSCLYFYTLLCSVVSLSSPFNSVYFSFFKPNYFWAPEKLFCIPCGCSALGSASLQCDMLGRCICRSGFMGRHCEISRQLPKLQENTGSSQQIRVPPRRWGASSAGGCPRGAYRPAALVMGNSALHGLKSPVCLCLELTQIAWISNF